MKNYTHAGFMEIVECVVTNGNPNAVAAIINVVNEAKKISNVKPFDFADVMKATNPTLSKTL